MSSINVRQSVDLTADGITSHVYEDGSAYLELGTDNKVGQSIDIWVGREKSDPAEDARMLRRLAEVANELAAGLESRAGTGGAS